MKGSSTLKVAPVEFGVLWMVILPLWASTIAATIASPRPLPPVSRVRESS